MRWQIKATVQKALSVLPNAESANYFMQRRVTKNLPTSERQFLLHFHEALQHLERHERYGTRPLAEVRAYEFGAGWDLVGPLSLWSLGVERQTIVDIEAHVRWELVAHTVGHLRRHRDALETETGRKLRLPGPAPVNDADGLRETFGIDYRAPLDARATGLPAGSFDLISSTFTLEHIPADDIAAILRESARLLAPGGVLTSSIDMQDHYAFSDPRISVYNFLRYSERTWRLINSPLHHQNRLRARDHIALHEAAGLQLVEVVPNEPDEELLGQLDAVPVSADFRSRYTRAELAPTDLRVTAVGAAA